MLRFIGRLIASAVILIVTVLSMAIAKYLSPLLFPLYRDFSRRLLGKLASFTGSLPFALWEWLLVLLLLLFFYSIVHTLLQKKRFLSWLSGVVLTVSVLAFLFVGLWGLNHYAPPLSEELGLDVGAYTKQELIDATKYYMAEAARLADEADRNPDGTLALPDFGKLAEAAGRSYAPLAARYPVFDGSTAPVKRTFLTTVPLNYFGTTGIFVCFTAESTVNPDTFSASLAHTMCHEVAHRCGIAAEDEANFAAFLACDASSDPVFRYSGYYDAFIYCYNALFDVDKAAAQALWNDSNRQLRLDCSAANDHYAPYEGAVQDAANKVNDAYLKTFSEESGVQSYGEAADYLIAWYLR